MAGLIYDREAHRPGPLLRGHLLRFDGLEVVAAGKPLKGTVRI